MLNKEVVNKTSNGFKIIKSNERIAKEQREQRVNLRKTDNNGNITNKELFEFLLDMAERQSEMYDMLKELSKQR